MFISTAVKKVQEVAKFPPLYTNKSQQDNARFKKICRALIFFHPTKFIFPSMIIYNLQQSGRFSALMSYLCIHLNLPDPDKKPTLTTQISNQTLSAMALYKMG